VASAEGHRWSVHQDLLKGEKLGNQLGADPATAVWWACAGDASLFDPASFKRPELPELTAFDGKVRFCGTVGSAQIRDGNVTLSLGAAGDIQVGKCRLTSDGAATKTGKW